MENKLDVGQFAQLAAAVVGVLPQDLDPEVMKEWIASPDMLGQVLRGALSSFGPQLAARQHSSGVYAAEHGYKVVDGHDVEPTLDLDVDALAFNSVLNAGESHVDFDSLLVRAKALNGNLGLRDAYAMLVQQSKIPVGLRDKRIAFTGTKLRRSTGHYMAFLACGDDFRWQLDFAWIIGGADADVVVPCKVNPVHSDI